MSKVSVVIPCLNDDSELAACLGQLPRDDPDTEVIVADASPDDACADIAHQFGATLVRCGRTGRGCQLNEGAAAATGDILVFNHADSELHAGHLRALRAVMSDSRIVGGAFHRDVAWQYPALAWMTGTSRHYTKRFGYLYGDQSVFVRRETFEAMGRFADVSIMEDLEFSPRLRKAGRIALLDPPIRASVRRFQNRGYLRNKLQNLLIIWAWRLGLVTPDQVYEKYYGRSPASKPAARR